MNAKALGILALLTLLPISAQAESLPDLAGNIGPQYDPLFYDVMVYVFGVIVFAIFLLSVISFWLRRRGLGGTSKEKWVTELEKYYEREGVGLLPEQTRK